MAFAVLAIILILVVVVIAFSVGQQVAAAQRSVLVQYVRYTSMPTEARYSAGVR